MPPRPRLAALVSVYHRYAHAQHIVDRFLEGYGWRGRHHRPAMDVVSMYVDQVGANDVSHERANRFPQLQLYPTIADALTLGGSQLAVDGVLLIAEHGEYPVNAKGQTLWPRYEFFRQAAAVFRASGRGVPVFVDKHLSWNWDWAKEMYDTARELGFPLLAGSSLPVTWRLPAVDLPLGAKVEEAMCAGCGWVDGGDFHAYETVQAMVERRAGGEVGVSHLQAFRGEAFWEAHAAGRWSSDLFAACLSRSHQLGQARAGFNDCYPSIDELRSMVADPWAYQYEHLDGLRCTIMALNGLFGDFAFAARLAGQTEPLSTQPYLPMPPSQATLASFFSPLANHVEQMILTGKPPYPVERNLLTTGLTAAGVESLHQGQTRIETPHLHIAYQPSPESTYWRD